MITFFHSKLLPIVVQILKRSVSDASGPLLLGHHEGQDEVDQGVEDDEGQEAPAPDVVVQRGEVSLGEAAGQEYRHHPEYEGGVARGPVRPVEQRPGGGAGVGAERGHDWLEEGQEDADQAHHGVRVDPEAGQSQGRHLHLHQHEDDGGDGEHHGEGHEAAVEDEPEILAAQLPAAPRPLEVARHDHAGPRAAQPRRHHQHPVQLEEQRAAAAAHAAHPRQAHCGPGGPLEAVVAEAAGPIVRAASQQEEVVQGQILGVRVSLQNGLSLDFTGFGPVACRGCVLLHSRHSGQQLGRDFPRVPKQLSLVTLQKLDDLASHFHYTS